MFHSQNMTAISHISFGGGVRRAREKTHDSNHKFLLLSFPMGLFIRILCSVVEVPSRPNEWQWVALLLGNGRHIGQIEIDKKESTTTTTTKMNACDQIKKKERKKQTNEHSSFDAIVLAQRQTHARKQQPTHQERENDVLCSGETNETGEWKMNNI